MQAPTTTLKRYLAAAAFIITTVAAATSYGANYAKYLEITAAGVPEGVTLTDFPLLVRLSTDISGFAYTDFVNSDGTDLRFEDANGNALAYDIDTWNTAGESLVWIKVPTLQKDDVITAKFGSVAPDANDSTNVWSNYVFVWHGNGHGTGQDATGNERTITPSGSGFALSQDEAAFLGSCFKNESTANNKKVTITQNPFSELASYSQFAVSGWIKPAMTEPTIRIFSTKSEHSQDGMEFLAVKGSGIFLRGKGGSANNNQIKWTDGYQELKKLSWTFVAGVVNGTDGTAFANSLIETTDKLLAPQSAGNGFAICGYAGADYAGSTESCIDEIRLYNGVPADAYLSAEYAQVVSNNYVTYSAVSATSSDAATITDAPAVVRNGDGTYTISATFTGTVGSTYDVEVQLNGVAADTQSVTLETTETNVTWTTAANLADGTYLPRVQVSIGSSVVLRAADTTFLAGNLSFGTCTDAYEEGLVSGEFVLTRPGATDQPLTVAYPVSSPPAVSGRSYVAFSGSAAFGAGDSTVSIPVVPLNDSSLTADATLTLALSGGLYGIASGSESDSVTLVNFAPPEGYNVWIAPSGSDGLASTASNWSANRAPIATDKILLGAWSSQNMTWDAAAAHTVASWTQNAEYTGTVTFPITYEGADVDAGFNLFTVTGDVALNGGHWVHPVQGPSIKSAETEPVERYRLNVSVGGDMSVASGVNISAQGRGRGFWTNGETNSWYKRAAHGGYVITRTNDMFGAESNTLFKPYGSILAPVATGKGVSAQGDQDVSNGHAGGALHLDVAGELQNNGRIIANGQTATGSTGGSGGSIWVTAAAISGTGKFEADATTANGSGAKAAATGGRISLIATGSNAATASTASANGSRSPDQWQVNNQPYHEGAAGTVWMQSATNKTLLVRNSNLSGTFEQAPYIRAYTPIPADDDLATFKAAIKDATLYVASNGRVRIENNLKFKKLMVRTATASLAHLDLHGNTLTVESVVDTGDNPIQGLGKGTYTLADALANGWTWFEDATAVLNEERTAVVTPGTGKLVVGKTTPTVITLK